MALRAGSFGSTHGSFGALALLSAQGLLGCTPPAPPRGGVDALTPTAEVNGRARTEASAPPLEKGEPAPLSLAEQGLSRGGDSPLDRALASGDAAWSRGLWDEAREHYEAATALAPDDPASWVGRARVLLVDVPLAYGAAVDPSPGEGGSPVPGSASDRAARALQLLGRALELDETFLPALFETGRVLLAQGRAREALGPLEVCVHRVPSDPEAHSAWGVALLANGQVEEAREPFERAVELDPGRAERHANLGTAYLMIGELPAAVRSYQTAARIDPESAQYQSDLGTALLAQGRYEPALHHLGRAVALAPERATFLSNLAYARLVGGDAAEAARLARRAIALDPELGSAWINLGTAEARRGRLGAAREALEQALVLDPTDPRARENLAELAELEAADSPR